MPKRISASYSPQNKRAKTDQFRIDQFFASSSRASVPEVIDVDLLDVNDNNDISGDGPTTNVQISKTTKSPSRLMAMGYTEEPTENASDFSSLTSDPVFFDPHSLLKQPSNGIPYSFLAHALSMLSATRSRISIMNVLTNTFRVIMVNHQQSLLPAVYLLSNTLNPPYYTVELGLGYATISQAIQHVSGLSQQAIKKLYTTTGDLGDCAFEAKSKTRTLMPHPPLLVTAVYDSLIKISQLKGKGVAKQRQNIIEKLLVAAKGEETRFLVRTLCQNLRVGAVRTSILNALARASVLTPPPNCSALEYHASPQLISDIQPLDSSAKKKAVDSARENLNTKFTQAERRLRTVYVQHPNYGHIIPSLLRRGLDNINEDVPLTLGIPLYPALGTPIRSLDEVYEQTGDRPFVAEFKYDGQRALIHAWKDEANQANVRIFSRHLEDMTSKYPDVVIMAESFVEEAGSFILDSEIVAIDVNSGDLKNFQELAGRARKDVKLEDVSIPVCVLAFDLMFLDGNVLLNNSYRERRDVLRERFPPFESENRKSARFGHVESCDSEQNKAIIEAFWNKAVASPCEGLMVKLLDHEPSDFTGGQTKLRKRWNATYDPDERRWFKLKRDYVNGLGDSLDLIPIGAWHGNGRKAQWWSPILLGVFNPQTNRVVAVCKCMSGFTDSFYKALTERYALTEDSETCSHSPQWECDFGGFRPHVYFKPCEVYEIRGADVTLSPVSVAACGLVSSEKGLSLRFPRFIRKREDKDIQSASTPEFLANMWRSQQGVSKGGDNGDDLIDIISESELEEEEFDE